MHGIWEFSKSRMREFVKAKLQGESTGHDYDHACRVFTNAQLIGKGLDIDWEIVEAACFCHDLIDRKVNACSRDALIYKLSQRIADEKVSSVMFIIENMSFSKAYKGDKTLEMQVVQDADRLEALGAVGIARCFATSSRMGRTLSDSMEHFHDKLYKLKDLMNLKVSKELAVEREAYMKEFERRFLNSK